jgi:hypothetical protein
MTDDTDTELQVTEFPFEEFIRRSDVPNDAKIMDIHTDSDRILIEWLPSDD